VNKYQSLTLGIDATNLRQGGGLQHILAILQHFDPERDGFDRIILWAPPSTLDSLPDTPWLFKSHYPVFERGFIRRGLWQWRELPREATKAGVHLMFIPGGSAPGGFQPAVVMFQNLLPFDATAFKLMQPSILQQIRLKVLGFIYKYSLRRATGLIFLSAFAKGRIIASVGQTSVADVVIPHGIDASFKSAPRHHRYIEDCHPSNPFRLLYVSAIDFYKHPWQVVEAVAVLRTATGWPLKLILAGPATSELALARLQSAMRRFDPAGSFVEYLGEVPHADMPALYASADMAVFASTCENLPMIVLEKMAMGLPIACSEYPAMRALLGEDAVWFDPASIASVAEALRALISDPQRRVEISQHNRSKAASYDWDRVTRETFKFLRGRVG
jgi:glycosyltransferase involved in cell wall biosynthesis